MGYPGGGNGGGAHHNINYKALSKHFMSKTNSACTITLDQFVGIVKCLCGRQTCTSIFEKNCQLTFGNRLKVCMVRQG